MCFAKKKGDRLETGQRFFSYFFKTVFHAQRQNQLWKMKVHPILFVIFVKFHHLNKNKSFWFFSKGLVGGISMPRCKNGKKTPTEFWDPFRPSSSNCDFIPEVRGGPDWQWSLGCPKWFRRRAWKGDVLKIQFPRGEEKFLSSREWVKWVFAFDGLTTLYLCKSFGSIPGWSCLWYLTILL